MTKAFTVASWNVEHFENNPSRIDLVIEFMKKQNPEQRKSEKKNS